MPMRNTTLGLMCASGTGVPKNAQQAAAWLTLSNRLFKLQPQRARAKQANQPEYDQINCDDVVQQTGNYEEKYADDQGCDGSQVQLHRCFP